MLELLAKLLEVVVLRVEDEAALIVDLWLDVLRPAEEDLVEGLDRVRVVRLWLM